MDWRTKLEAALDGVFIDDLTSPGEACFMYFIGITPPVRLGSSALTEYLRRGGHAYAVRIEISAEASTAAIAFCRWMGNPTALETADTPYTAEQAALYAMLTRFAEENGLTLIPAEELPFDEE